MSEATTSHIDTEGFRQRWIAQFKEQAALSLAQIDPWDGYAAYRELSDTNNLWLVLPTRQSRGWPFNWLTQKLAREVHFYRLFHKEIVPTNQCFKIALSRLAAAESKLKKTTTKESSVKAELDRELKKSASMIERTRIGIERRRKSYWDDSLFAEPTETETWMVEYDAENRVHSIPPEDLSQRERIFEKAKYPRQLVKRIDLDARFQVRVAVILRSYVLQDSGISLRTISRLAVLTYICGNLGNEKGGVLIVDGREITVDAVDQKIRATGLK